MVESEVRVLEVGALEIGAVEDAANPDDDGGADVDAQVLADLDMATDGPLNRNVTTSTISSTK